MRTRLLLGVMFLTAFSSLVYELVWTRLLSHLFGVSALAEATVLGTFMGGLALGSAFGGRLIARARDRVRFLGILQLAIGVTCLLVLFGVRIVHANYLRMLDLAGDHTYAFLIALFLAASILLIVPTFLIGVAFPAIVQLVHDNRRRVGESVGSTYMVDTLGGSLGLIVAAFFLVPRIGFTAVSLFASSLNLVMGVMLLLASRRTSTTRAEAAEPAPESVQRLAPSPRRFVVPVLFFSTGFAALCFEVLWIRHVSLIYGGSMYAFAIVVVSFLAGIGIGSLLYNAVFRRVRDHVWLFAACLTGVGLSGLFITMLMPKLERLFVVIYTHATSYSQLMLALGATCFAVLLIPTILMGLTLPVLSALHASRDNVGGDVGRLFAVNSFGALVGSVAAGFLLIPALGIHTFAFVPGAIYIICAVLFVLVFHPPGRPRARGLALLAAIVSVVGAGSWLLYRPSHLYNGVFYVDDAKAYFAKQRYAEQHLLFLEDGPYGQVAVHLQSSGTIVVMNNGKIDASSDGSNMTSRDMGAHVPILLHDDAREILTIGLGGGWTAAAALKHDVTSVDVVELNPVMVRANREVLAPYNENSLGDPRTHVIVADGRNYLAATNKRYDVISSEPPEIWVGGVSGLFTREFYATARRALREDGLLCQWIPRYEMTAQDYQMTLATIRQSFPYLYEFDMLKVTEMIDFPEILLIGSAQPLDIQQRIKNRRFRLALDDSPKRDELLEMLEWTAETWMGPPNAVAPTLSDEEAINTDDLPLLEFHTARNRFRKFRPEE